MQENKKNIVVLYTELASYTMACLNELALNSKILVVKYDVNAEAPFKFNYNSDIEFLTDKKMSSQELHKKIQKFQPSLIVCAGWNNQKYNQICRFYFKQGIPTICGFDNQWNNTIRQKVLKQLSPFTLKKIFSHVWIAGEAQLKYAQKLGYDQNKIIHGYYSCDSNHFQKIFSNSILQKRQSYPHVFLYIGRYIKRKGISELFKAFQELCEEENHDWELWCIGTGELFENRVEHPRIKHFGFIQPENLLNYIKSSGCFILPSHHEPWGVVIHEMAIAGLPIISTTSVGANTSFLKTGKNGYVAKNRDSIDLKNQMKNIIHKKDDDLIDMAINSNKIGLSYTLLDWTSRLISIK